jgi:hypothetical protein
MKTCTKRSLFGAILLFTTFLLTTAGPATASSVACTWTAEKVATLGGVPITTLNLALDETITIDYRVTITRTCPAGFDPFAEGGSSDIVDSYAGVLTHHLFVDNLDLFASRTFTYSRDITAESCDPFVVTNTVEAIDGDPAAPFARASANVSVTVRCGGGGCTLTQGYWKTHSAYGPAPKTDPTWLLVGGPDAPFFFSGASWYQVFWTPTGGNVYYQLAHQYMAARLNTLNDASAPSSVNDAITGATSYFANPANTPAAAAALSKAAKKTLQGYASTLDSYNTGAIGPGHCDE